MTREQFVAFVSVTLSIRAGGWLLTFWQFRGRRQNRSALRRFPYFFQQRRSGLRLACSHLRKHAAASGKTKLVGLKCESMRLHCGFSVQLLFQVQLLWKQHLQQSGLSSPPTPVSAPPPLSLWSDTNTGLCSDLRPWPADDPSLSSTPPLPLSAAPAQPNLGKRSLSRSFHSSLIQRTMKRAERKQQR